MKKLLLVAILAFSYNVIAQIKQPTPSAQYPPSHFPLSAPLSSIQIMDSVKNWEWDAQSYRWKNKSKNTNMVYNSNNFLTSYITQTWNGSTWENTGQYTYTYDASNNMTSETYQTWNGSNWLNTGKNIMSYDAGNNQTSNLYQSWTNNTWQNSGQTIYTYDAGNNMTSKLFQSWYGNSWVNSHQESYTYDNSNNLTIHLFQVWTSNTLVNSMKYSYTYDGNNNQTSFLHQMWNNGWVNYLQYSYTYDTSNNQTSNLYQVWNVTSWENQWRYSYTYDANNNQTIALKMNWTGSYFLNYIQQLYSYDAAHNKVSESDQEWVGTAWRDHWRYFYAYNANNDLTSIITQNTDGSGQWNCYDQTTNTYDVSNFELSHLLVYWSSDCNVVLGGDSTYNYIHSGTTGITAGSLTFGNITVYPNPSRGKFTISSESMVNSIAVYNMLDQQVYFKEGFQPQKSGVIDLSGQPKGIYFARTTVGTKMILRKLVIQ